jgi:hypothetical protein
MQQAINKSVQQKLPTYKKVLTNHRSKNLELQSHLPAATGSSHLDYFIRALPGWGMLVPVFSCLDHS